MHVQDFIADLAEAQSSLQRDVERIGMEAALRHRALFPGFDNPACHECKDEAKRLRAERTAEITRAYDDNGLRGEEFEVECARIWAYYRGRGAAVMPLARLDPL
jgi:hypothetical protein